MIMKIDDINSCSSSFLNYAVLYKEEVDSTNLWIKQLAKEGAPEGTVTIADAQTAGRGRLGRVWASEGGHSVYMSILLRPQIAPEQASMLTLAAGLAAAKACDQIYKMHTDANAPVSSAQIKWPNDVVLSGKKVCGILTEMGMDGAKIAYVVVGIGINVNAEAFPEEIRHTATSLALESGVQISREEVIKAVLTEFDHCYKQFLETGNLANLLLEYNEMLVNRNREIRVLDPKGEYGGVAAGINEKGELIVNKKDGTCTEVYAGEVSVRGIYGYV